MDSMTDEAYVKAYKGLTELSPWESKMWKDALREHKTTGRLKEATRVTLYRSLKRHGYSVEFGWNKPE